MATIFTYKGQNDFMDNGYTEHSGCPVIEGEKVVLSLWMREGDAPATNRNNMVEQMVPVDY
jgi:hypothetical protein